jgi:hypothetical protein
LAGTQDTSISDVAVLVLTDDLESVEVSFNITRHGSSVVHSFTHWGQVAFGDSAYDATADLSSWYDTTKLLEIFSDSLLGTQKSTICELQPAAATNAVSGARVVGKGSEI